jgi:Cof subfamily protein (haloacid dehalogenase superfamily)
MLRHTTQQLIALDLDGTLLDGAGRVTTRAIGAISAVIAAGYRIVIATGRPPDLALRATHELAGLVSHIVGGNGTIISTFPADPHTKPELVHVSGFDAAAAFDVVTTLRGHDERFGFALATDNGFAHEPGFAELMPAAVHDDAVDDATSIGGSTVFKLLVFHPGRSVDMLLDDVPTLIAHLGTGFAVRHLGADAVEIGPAADDKGAGLRWLCGHLGVEAADVIAVGDELNDLTMLEWAGSGVAVANADERVRAAADRVIGSHLDDGVAIFLEELAAADQQEPLRQDHVKTP